MSKGLGTVVLLAGLGGLGAWSYVDHAEDMEGRVTAGASAAVNDAASDVAIEVSGRDIILRGTAESEEEISELIAAANAVEGRRIVRSELALLPVAAPYLTSVVKSATGDFTADGTVPNKGLRTALAGDAAPIADLSLARGAPDGYAAASAAGVAALAQLQEGSLTIADNVVTLTGVAADADALAAAEQSLADLPDNIEVVTDVTFVPVADPFEMAVNWDGAAYIATGVTPDADLPSVLNDATGADAFAGLTLAKGAPDGWTDAATVSVDALSQLEMGAVQMSGQSITITGDAPDEATFDAVSAQMSGISGFEIVNDVTFVPVADPFVMAVEKAGEAYSVSGVTPDADLAAALNDQAGVPAFDALTLARGAPDGWADAAAGGLAALSRLDAGQLDMSGNSLRISGEAPDADAFVAINDQMAAVAGFDVANEVTFVPVADPFVMNVTKNPDGYVVSGVTPDVDLVAALNEQAGSAAFEALTVARGAPDGWAGAAATGLTALSRLEAGQLLMQDQSVRITGAAPDEAAFDAINSEIASIAGYDLANEVTFTPLADRFVMNVDKTADGLRADGLTPDAELQAALNSQTGTAAFDGLEIANGAPDGWNNAATVSLDALAQLDTGRLVMEDQAIRLSGEAPDQAAYDAVKAQLAALDGYAVTNSVTFVPTAAPFVMSVDKDGFAYFATGVTPAADLTVALNDQSGSTAFDELTLAKGVPEGWNNAAAVSLDALGQLEAGRLVIEDQTILISGQAADEAAFDAIAAQLAAVDGYEVTNEVTFVPTADPFTMSVQKNANAYVVQGVTPDADLAGALNNQTGSAAFDALTLAQGAPDGWNDAAAISLAALDQLPAGTLNMEGQAISIAGKAPSQDAFDNIAAQMDAITGFEVANDVTFVPRPERFIMRVIKDADGYNVTGVTPSIDLPAALNDQVGSEAFNTLTLADGAAEGWSDAANVGVDVLAQLDGGRLEMDGQRMLVAGEAADADALATVTAQLDAVNGFTVINEITFVPAAPAFVMTASKDANGRWNVEGQTPSADALGLLMDASASFGTLELAEGAPEGWAAAADVSVSMLDLLEQGVVEMAGATIRIAGDAPDAATRDSIRAQMSAIEGYEIINEVTYTPPVLSTDMVVRYDAERGLFVSGIVPDGLGRNDIGAIFNGETVRGGASYTSTDPAEPVEVALRAINPNLADFEEIEIAIMRDQVDATGIVTAASDLAAVTDVLTASGAFTSVNLTQAEPIESNMAACDEGMRNILAEKSVNFVTGSSNVTDASDETLTEIAKLANECFAENDTLKVIIEGHTDDVGGETANRNLSDSRANRVRAELIERGVTEDRITAVGFGEEQPIADNTTVEGRAENRRTAFVWLEE